MPQWDPGVRWLSQALAECFGEFCDQLSSHIGSWLEEQSDVSETSLTDSLIREINSENRSWARDFRECIHRAHPEVYATIQARKNTIPAESKIGADLGMILDIHVDSTRIRKAIFIQAKRAFDTGGKLIFSELERRGFSQANKMLKITPSSFFFLYTGHTAFKYETYETLLREHFYSAGPFSGKNKRLAKKYIHRYDFSYPFADYEPFNRFLWNEVKNEYSGILVCPAGVIASSPRPDASLESLLPSSVSLRTFFTDYFLPCFVGDQRKGVILKAGGDVERRVPITRYTVLFSVSRGQKKL